MSLSKRLAEARGTVEQERTVYTFPTEEEPKRDPLADLKRRVQQSLLSTLGPQLYDLNVSPEQLEARVRAELTTVLESDATPISSTDRARLIAETTDDILGNGPIEPFLRDNSVSEVMVNGAGTIYVERAGKLVRTQAHFLDDAHLRRTIERIVERVGRRIDESQPYVDARLPDGSRVNAVIPPIAIDGPSLTIRKFSQVPYRSTDLVSFGTVTETVSTFLEACVRGRINILVSGGTGAGKTTTLNVLSSWIGEDERIVTIEDSAELRLLQPHVVRLEHRPMNIEGNGEVTIRSLVRNALRMRPDRIVVGEVRGGEALDMLQAMNTGHDGSISTVHANTPRDALARVETMCLMAGMDLPVRAIREQMASAVQLIVHQQRLNDGTRRVTHVSEVAGMEGDVITMQDIFRFDFGMGMDEQGKFRGRLKALGLRPGFMERLVDAGQKLAPEIFDPTSFERANQW
jgi:pilus assembly protein CpaF